MSRAKIQILAVSVVAFLAVVGCGVAEDPTPYDPNGNGNGSNNNSSNNNNNNGSGGAKAGAACKADADCQSGMRCLNSMVPGQGRYCGRSCTKVEDCRPMHDQTYGIKLPAKVGASYNHYRSDTLWRGTACMDPAEFPAIGTADGKRWCVYICPNYSAFTVDKQGQIDGCACLPNYKKASSAKGQLNCVWDSSVECSVFTPCTVKNTQKAQCSAGNFKCVMHEGLEGICYDFVTGSQIEACIAKCNWDCNPSCVANCGADQSCISSCCKSSDPNCK
jgi:hypothetical protein